MTNLTKKDKIKTVGLIYFLLGFVPLKSVFSQAVDFNRIYNEVPGFRFKGTNATISYIVSDLLPYVFVLAGILLLFFLIAGGLEMMTSAGNPKSSASAKEKITAALVGFIIIFAAYWITQLLQAILGINVGII